MPTAEAITATVITITTDLVVLYCDQFSSVNNNLIVVCNERGGSSRGKRSTKTSES